MKKIINFISIMVLFYICFTPAYSHKEWVHQYIIKEAYKLLYNEVGTITPLNQACGFDNNGNDILNSYDNDPCGGSIPFWETPTCNWEANYPLLRGAYVEDSYDILLGYCFDIFTFKHWDASDGHFWKADDGDDVSTQFPPVLPAINAFRKADFYYHSCIDNPIEIAPYNIQVDTKYLWFSLGHCTTRSIKIAYPFNPYLCDFILNGNVYLMEWNWRLGDLWKTPFKTSNPHLNNIDEHPNFGQKTNKFVYGMGILGRICHLLADMSVPAHVHARAHPCKILGSWSLWPIEANGDIYELTMGHGYDLVNDNPVDLDPDFQRENCNNVPYRSDQTFYAKLHYNQTTTRTKNGLIWELFEINDENYFEILHYLFYTLNQLSDLYKNQSIVDGSVHDYGNRNLVNSDEGINPYLNYRYNELNPSQNDVIVDEQADELFNYAIRATASLMYWMSYKLGWLDQNPLCRKDIMYFQNERIFGYNINKINNNLEFKVMDYSHTSNTGKIIAGKNVNSNNIIPKGDVIVDPSVNLTFTAAKEIHLEDGFSVLNGADFHARITNINCDGNNRGIVLPNETNELKNNYEYTSKFNLYPNPSNHIIKIFYSFSYNCNISIFISNSFSERIANLITNQETSAGNNNLSFDVSNLPDGVYFVTLISQDYTETKKFMVIH